MAEHVKILVSLLGMIGIPSIFSMTIWCMKQCKRFASQITILHSAQKAQMRNQLLDQYYTIKNRGYVWSDELDEWVNSYNAYHELVGENGVLDARKTELEHYPSQVR